MLLTSQGSIRYVRTSQYKDGTTHVVGVIAKILNHLGLIREPAFSIFG